MQNPFSRYSLLPNQNCSQLPHKFVREYIASKFWLGVSLLANLRVLQMSTRNFLSKWLLRKLPQVPIKFVRDLPGMSYLNRFKNTLENTLDSWKFASKLKLQWINCKGFMKNGYRTQIISIKSMYQFLLQR